MKPTRLQLALYALALWALVPFVALWVVWDLLVAHRVQRRSSDAPAS
jgi:hypothetical protein